MWQLLKGALAHKMRLVHTAVAAALAVSLVCGTFILTDTVDSSFSQAAAAATGDVDVIVRSTSQFTADGTALSDREPLPTSLVGAVSAAPGVASAWGLVWGYAELVDKQGKAITAQGLPTIGTAWSPSHALASGRAPDQAGEIVIDESIAKAHGFSLGDRIKVLFQGVVEEFTIRGLRAAGDWVASTLATFEMKTAQRVLGRENRLDAIAVQAQPGVSPDRLRAQVAGVLPDRYQAVTNDQAVAEAEASATKALGFLTTGLLVFAAVALLVGGFIIFNTFSILIAQRTRELAVLRALGASRSQLMVYVLAEAAAVGLLASAAGILLGFGAARGLLALMRSAGFEPPTTGVVFLPRTAIAALLAGVVVTLAAAVLPARRATRIAPVTSMTGRSAETGGSTRRCLAVGGGTALSGSALLLFALFANLQPRMPAVGLGITGLLVGLAILTPLLTQPAAMLLGAPLVRLFGEPAALGRQNAVRNPRRTAATAAALMIGIGLVGVVGILGASMKASADKTVRDTLRADFVIKAKSSLGGAAGVPPVVATRLRETPGVAVVSEIRAGQWGLNGKAQSVLAVDPPTVARVQVLDRRSAEAVGRLGAGNVLVRDTIARRNQWRVGDEIPMTFARTGTQRLRLADTFSATTVRADYVITLPTFEANFAQQLDAEVRVALVPGTLPQAGRGAIAAALADFPNVDVMNRSEVLAAQAQQVNRLMVPITALLVLSIVIALLGIANTLALSIHERTREIGLLRAIGMGRSQLRSMIRWEAVIIASLGAVLGVAVAIFLGWALVSALADLGVTELVIPLGQLSGLVAAAAVAGLLAGVLPARRAAQLRVLDAVAAS